MHRWYCKKWATQSQHWTEVTGRIWWRRRQTTTGIEPMANDDDDDDSTYLQIPGRDFSSSVCVHVFQFHQHQHHVASQCCSPHPSQHIPVQNQRMINFSSVQLQNLFFTQSYYKYYDGCDEVIVSPPPWWRTPTEHSGVDKIMPLLTICSTVPSRVNVNVEGLNIFGNSSSYVKTFQFSAGQRAVWVSVMLS